MSREQTVACRLPRAAWWVLSGSVSLVLNVHVIAVQKILNLF